MNSVLNELGYYFSFPFVQYALIVGVLIALCSALFGVILVLKRFSFLGDGLSHTAFGALAIATVLGVNNEIYVVLPITAVLAVFLLKKGQNTKVKGDAALAMMSVGALAIGYMILNIFPGSPNIAGDVCSTLFGATSILTLDKTDVLICAVFAGVVIALFMIFYNKIFAVTFDESFSEGTGINTDAYNIIIAVVTAVIIVVAMNLVGSLLISALIVFPALSAMRIYKSFLGTVICSAIVAVVSAMLGIVISILASTPVGPSIVVMNILFFVLFTITGRFIKV
ncbi:MAG: metal ABC transporter permease [Clostridia bacterium]|nr:metal ABC transporter permease [Clostridia bacterium]